jgi:hypothetical protein
MTLPRVVLFPTLCTVISSTHYLYHPTLAFHYSPIWQTSRQCSTRYRLSQDSCSLVQRSNWVRGPSRKVDANADLQTMPTRLAITLPRTSHMLRPPRVAVCLCIETNHQAALLWHRVAHFEVRPPTSLSLFVDD